MSHFTLILNQPSQLQRIEGVTAFIAQDDSGSFGILPGHTRLITSLALGLARYRIQGANWRYLAMSHGLLYFHRQELRLSAQRFLLCDEYQHIEQVLRETLAQDEETLGELNRSVRTVEEHLLQRLSQLETMAL